MKLLTLPVLSTLACLFLNSNAEYFERCGNSSENGVSFTPSVDSVKGRYTVEWCTKADTSVTKWELLLRVLNDNRKPERCKHFDVFDIHPHEVTHSRVTENIKLLLNCTITCLSTKLDLIFSGCYSIKTWLMSNKRSWGTHDSLHYITNQYKSAAYFNNSKTYVRTKSYNENVTAHWYLGYIPVMEYHMQLCKENVNNTEWESECTDVSQQCAASSARTELECTLRPGRGCYKMRLQHREPWLHGEVFSATLYHIFWKFCHPDAEAEAVTAAPGVGAGVGGGAGGAAARWALGGCAALAAAAAAACAVWRSRLAAALRKQVLRDWVQRYEDFGNENAAKPANEAAGESVVSRVGGLDIVNSAGGADVMDDEEGPRCVLVLYARDCEAAMRCARGVCALVRRALPGRVLELFAPELAAAAAAAGAPHDWLRRALRRRRVAVLLLQTPATAALYGTDAAAATNTTATTTPGEPLLPARVRYREPHYGDTLLQFALRLITDTAHTQTAYKKYYIATLAELPGETLAHVAPFRRYVLPAAAALLLRDLQAHVHPPPAHPARPAAPPPPPPPALPAHDPLLQQLARDTAALVQYVRDNPNYLQDELVFL